MRQWPHAPTIAHLVFLDHQELPSATAVADAVDHARARGARAIRTSALFPDAAEILMSADFEPIDRLALLAIDLDDGVVERLGDHEHAIRPLRRWMHARAADVDVDAFGPMWGNDAAGLREIRAATPVHQARYIGDARRIAGFAVSGAAAGNGYVQRVAVASAERRRGVARALVIDALRWIHDGGRRRALVNTGVSNAAALGLYEQLGFRRLDDVLTIAERRLGG
ncbi:MAG: GNAT family N-acetyltransferase [Ilumatobacter sp.]|nr:GNAT family N-acetyltransferase [Ilumatobacter sp.]